MDDRSRKLLSNQALPKAKLPEPKAHERREFKLPTGVTPKPVLRASSAGLEALRAKALDEGVKLAEGSKGNVRLPGVAPLPAPAVPSAPGQQVAALGDLKWPAIGTPPPPFPEAASAKGSAPSPSAAGKFSRKPPTASVPPPAPPIPAPVLNLTKKKVAAAPAPAKLPVPAPLVAKPTVKPPVLADYDEKTPAPLPPPPTAGGKGRQPALVVAEGAPSFREATTMWFRAGEEQAARAVRDAEADAMERAEEAFLAGRSRGKLLLLAVVAMAAVLLLVLFLK
jgi:hypothetical protein